MPVVIVKLVEGASREEKARVIARITAVLQEEMGKNPETTHVILEEYPVQNWGIRGKSVEALRAGG